MIIKKPYVLLIKHFRKIHIILFVLGLFVYFMHTRLGSFMNEFLEYGIYNSYDPISRYIPWFSIIAILALIFFSISLISFCILLESFFNLLILLFISF